LLRRTANEANFWTNGRGLPALHGAGYAIAAAASLRPQ
jgi:hypothetical protein